MEYCKHVYESPFRPWCRDFLQCRCVCVCCSTSEKGLETAKELGAENYVFWGGREGYETLLNTDLKFELDNLARFMHMAVDYAKEIGYTGQFLIEPKPKEPTTHQYDTDAATTIAF